MISQSNHSDEDDRGLAFRWLMPAEDLVHFHWVELAPGETLFIQGDIADCVFFIIEGQLRLRRESGSGRSSALLESGHLVGEREMVVGHRRSATATAESRTRLLRISEAEYRRLKKGQTWQG